MTSDDSSIFLKQQRHLCLRKPNGFVFQSDINGSLPIIGLVYDDLIIHGCGGFVAEKIQKPVPNYCIGLCLNLFFQMVSMNQMYLFSRFLDVMVVICFCDF